MAKTGIAPILFYNSSNKPRDRESIFTTTRSHTSTPYAQHSSDSRTEERVYPEGYAFHVYEVHQRFINSGGRAARIRENMHGISIRVPVSTE